MIFKCIVRGEVMSPLHEEWATGWCHLFCQSSPLQEYQACNLESCPEVRRNTPWTPWVPVNITQGGARQEQRIRYICRAQLADPHELQLGKRKVETRFCPNDGTVTCETDCESLDPFVECTPTPHRSRWLNDSSGSQFSSCPLCACRAPYWLTVSCCLNLGEVNHLRCTWNALEARECQNSPCAGCCDQNVFCQRCCKTQHDIGRLFNNLELNNKKKHTWKTHTQRVLQWWHIY